MVEQLIEDSYNYLEEHPEAIDACQDFISEGYSVNEDYDKGNMTDTITLLLRAIVSVSTKQPIKVYRGMNENRYAFYKQLQEGESITVNRFTSTSLIQRIAEQHAEMQSDTPGTYITILIPEGQPAFFLNTVNDLPGGAIYGISRQVELLIDNVDGYEVATLDGDTGYANGEEEVLLGPGTFTCINQGSAFEYRSV